MYRAFVEERWLPWVSNADPEWMCAAQSKYNLEGTLDTGSYYAGIGGKNIAGVEIRVFEENSSADPPTKPTGEYKLINAPFYTQNIGYPTGCESVTTVMALQHNKIDMTIDNFIDDYLDKSGIVFDPNISFGGNPRGSGYGCYAPVIKKALDKILPGTGYYAKVLNNVPLSTLCSQYIDKDIPVILWATMSMRPPYLGNSWTYNGRRIQWIAPEHCLLLVGYDDNRYYFNDPLKWAAPTPYNKFSVEAAYRGLFSQAVVILKDNTTPKPEVDVAKLEKIDRKTLMNTYFYSAYYNTTHTDIGDIEFPSDLNDGTVLACMQLLFAYFWDQKDYEKTDALYDEMLALRKLNPSYQSIWAEFLNERGDFDMGYQYYAPGRKTTKITFSKAAYFSVDTIKKMHQQDDWMAFFISFIPGVGPFLSTMLSTMQTLEQNSGIGISDSVVSAFGDAQGPVLTEIMNIFKAPRYIATAMDLFASFTSTAYGTATEGRTTYVVRDGEDNKVTLQDGDAFLSAKISYDMGIENHRFYFYFRNGYPLVTNLEQFVVRSDSKAMGGSSSTYHEYERQGYVPSEKHLERGSFWPGK